MSNLPGWSSHLTSSKICYISHTQSCFADYMYFAKNPISHFDADHKKIGSHDHATGVEESNFRLDQVMKPSRKMLHQLHSQQIYGDKIIERG